MSIAVVGSLNMDLVTYTEKFPEPGETVIGNDFSQIPGGKGANQALNIACLEQEVLFIGACGKDHYGKILKHNLEKNGVNIECLYEVETSTGIASINVDNKGENKIIVVPGANYELTAEKIENLEEIIKDKDIILLQMEIPEETIIKTIEIAENSTIILDPAPPKKLPQGIYGKIDYILPNQNELHKLCKDCVTVQEKMKTLLNWGVKSVIYTRGAEGVEFISQKERKKYEAYDVENVVDRTGAGDALAGAFAYALNQGWEIERAISFANKVAGISVCKPGAQNSFSDKELEIIHKN